MSDGSTITNATPPGDTRGMLVHVGIDVGSTTVKVVAINAATREVLYSTYVRHHARQAETVGRVLQEFRAQFPEASLRAAVCGSGAMSLAEAFRLPFVQEVVANSIAVRTLYPHARTAIELGGQDAKMVFFAYSEEEQRLNVADMRMNGSCAGGTGAFIDEIASLLRIPVEEFDAAAAAGTTVHDVSGRCGVYAKTDIQPLLNQGVPKEDLARSAFHAIAKQTIGGLAQGLEITPPVIFEGGPLTFNSTLVDVFVERLGLASDQVVIPDHPETVIALGAALSLDELFADQPAVLDFDRIRYAIENHLDEQKSVEHANPFFANQQEKDEFLLRHPLGGHVAMELEPGTTARVFLGIDSGSTTTKFVLLDELDRVVDSFYASNEGEPLEVARQALLDIRTKFADANVNLDIVGVGTTGYGELLFNEAFQADFHVVETVAHSYAAQVCLPDVSFILDIGGQDMKAMWVEDGVITNIVVNEACSSGCGSFLETFASSLGIPVRSIAEAAFRAKDPAVLGSRCTVFMNSSIVTEQKNGKTPDDIMAGLCRSIIENVFTKVIRVSNLDSLGPNIVVQGGTFRNDAVLRAFEQYVGHSVTRAPYPGLMGAIGAAMLTRQHMQEAAQNGVLPASTFIGLDALDDFSYEQETNLVCPWCANGCNRTRIVFNNGSQFVIGNRCPKGEVVGDPQDAAVRSQIQQVREAQESVPNLFDERERLLFQKWEHEQVLPPNGQVIGLPRVLFYWDSAPFWRVLWESLGFTVRFSRPSNRKLYERGLPAVASDTVCFPAKLVHGHMRDLVDKQVDRIFMPVITTVPTENTESTSVSMCAVVKGYAMVIRNSDNPERHFDVVYDDPLFHWYTEADRQRQLADYFRTNFGISAQHVNEALRLADAAQRTFRETLERRGGEIMRDCRKKGTYAVVLASRPYQNDALVNHDLPQFFTERGIPVLTADSVPGATGVDLSKSLIDVVNNFHARMLSTAMVAAGSENLEYVQIVSFGCGHDAYLSDEIIRLMREISGKTPLVLKVDESDIQGPLRIRVRSFIETVNMHRAKHEALKVHELTDPYPVKFTKQDKATKTVLVPNTSHAFSMLLAAAFKGQGLNAVSIGVGHEQAIRLGKKYVHNDICFPCQIVIGELLAELESGAYDLDNVAVAQGKYIGDCRLTHYASLTRKALDDAGYAQVPIVTNDDVDYHNIHPGFKMNLLTAIRIAYGLPMIDALEELLRKMRPYELVPGSANEAFDQALKLTVDGMAAHGIRGAKRGFAKGIALMKGVRYDRSTPRPKVLIVGEYLLNFHPGANHEIEDYLERNGFEIIEARMTDVIRKSYFYKDAQNKEYNLDKPFSEKTLFSIENNVFELAHNTADKIASAHPLYRPATRMPELVQASDPIIHHTFDAGEGVLIPGEILHHAAHGCRNFVILQPFGCLPNHVVGRGISKRLKELYPEAQILPLDYDPDVSFANVENRLQMLIMNAKH
ncbi:MAG: acyl-CoA dehydratase activase [Coriobacteriia bacterium]|nr:acyl-CoA dehydratase activase [Coriobacteriia bacterium]